MNILLINGSPRGQASESYRLAREITGFLRQKFPNAVLTNRSLDSHSMPHADDNYANAQHFNIGPLTAAGSAALSDELIRELEEADVLVIGTPMHNLGMSSALKAWIDHVVRARHTFKLTRNGKVGALRDRPVYVAIASGGWFSGEKARQPDFLTPYMKTILAMIGLQDVSFFSVQGTSAGPDVIAEARAKALEELRTSFSAP